MRAGAVFLPAAPWCAVAPPAGDVAAFLAAAAYVALAAWVLSIRPRQRQNWALAGYVLFFGLAIAAERWGQLTPGFYDAAELALMAVTAASMASAAWLAYALPGARHGSAWPGVVLGVAFLVVTLVLAVAAGGELLPTAMFRVQYALYAVALVAYWTALWLLFVRQPAGGAGDGMRPLLTVSLLLIYAFPDGYGISDGAKALAAGDPSYAASLVWYPAQDLLVGAAWLARGLWRGHRGEWGAGLLVLGIVAFGAVQAALGSGIVVLTAVVRFLGVLLIVYGILRRQLLGLDVKVRFAIKGSTVAAVFIAVFFVVSEVSQQFFADRSGSTYLGIAATGGLVFALAPLQRLADQVASRAVPAPEPVAWTPGDRRDGVYRNALRIAMRDRRLTPDEEVQLAELADELGIKASRALRLRQEAEAEAAASGRPLQAAP